MTQHCAIIGTGHAATQLAFSLRRQGWQGPITMIGEEPHPPYQRPPLSKALLAGEKELEQILLKRANAYEKAAIELRLGTPVTAIDRARQTLTLADGAVLDYDKLALTTGSRPRRVTLPGAELAGIHTLRNLADAQAIRAALKPGAKLVIVGGGYIGLEVAAVAVQAGVEVTLLEMGERILQRVTSPLISAFFTQLHENAGVRIRTGVTVSGFAGAQRVQRVLCTDGSEYAADLVLLAIGITPSVELAAEAGLQVDNGIVVDEYTFTSDPHIVAAGDCTNHPNALLGRRVRLESVQNAMEQAQAAAANLCGQRTPYRALPWFWSDQYDLTLQIAGLSQGYDELVVRGDPESHRFAVFYLQEGYVIAVDAINQLDAYMAGQRLITERRPVTRQQLADTRQDLKSLLA